METLAEVAARHQMTVEQWERLSPSERLTRARSLRPPVVRQKLAPYRASPEDVAALAGKTATERLTFGHARGATE